MIKKVFRIGLANVLGFVFAILAGMMFSSLQKPEHAAILGYVWFVAAVLIWWRLQPRKAVIVDG